MHSVTDGRTGSHYRPIPDAVWSTNNTLFSLCMLFTAWRFSAGVRRCFSTSSCRWLGSSQLQYVRRLQIRLFLSPSYLFLYVLYCHLRSGQVSIASLLLPRGQLSTLPTRLENSPFYTNSWTRFIHTMPSISVYQPIGWTSLQIQSIGLQQRAIEQMQQLLS